MSAEEERRDAERTGELVRKKLMEIMDLQADIDALLRDKHPSPFGSQKWQYASHEALQRLVAMRAIQFVLFEQRLCLPTHLAPAIIVDHQVARDAIDPGGERQRRVFRPEPKIPDAFQQAHKELTRQLFRAIAVAEPEINKAKYPIGKQVIESSKGTIIIRLRRAQERSRFFVAQDVVYATGRGRRAIRRNAWRCGLALSKVQTLHLSK